MPVHSLQWRHNGPDGVSNHQPHACLLNRLFRRRSKKISKLRVTCLCAGNSPVTGEFPAHRASNAKNVSIWWRHHDYFVICLHCTGDLPYCAIGFNHGLPWCVKYMARGPPVTTKPDGEAGGFCGDRRPEGHVFHTSRQAMIKTYYSTSI